MHRFRNLRQRVAWIACWAVLVGALAPVVSQWLASQQPRAVWAEICSAKGAVKSAQVLVAVSLGQEPDPGQGQQSRHGSHDGVACAYCVTHAGSFGLLPIDALAVSASVAVGDVIGHGSSPPIWIRVVRGAQPRAPPTVS